MNTAGSSKAFKVIVVVMAAVIVVLGGLVLVKNFGGGGLEQPGPAPFSDVESLRNSPDAIPDTTVAPKEGDVPSSENAA